MERRGNGPHQHRDDPHAIDAQHHEHQRLGADGDLVAEHAHRARLRGKERRNPCRQQQKRPEQQAVADDIGPPARTRAVGAHHAQAHDRVPHGLAARHDRNEHKCHAGRGHQQADVPRRGVVGARQRPPQHREHRTRHGHVDRKRHQPTRERGVLGAALDRMLLDLVHAGEEAAQRQREQVAQEGACRVGDEVVHVEEPVRVQIEPKQAGYLRDLKEE